MAELQVVAWLVHSGRAFVNRAFDVEAHAIRSVEQRKDGAQVEPLVRLSEATARIAEARREALEEAAKICDEQQLEPECPERASYCAAAIRSALHKEVEA